MRIGLIDVDTSHPANWMPLLKEMGHQIVAIWDGGSVHSPERVLALAAEHDVPAVLERLEDMIDQVDGVVIHSCNWDLHIERARPFVEAGKAVLIDKPLAGKVEDLEQLVAWADAGARISGGSSLRFTEEVATYLAQPPEERGETEFVLAGCGTDEFNYGIHGYSLLCSLVEEDPIYVRWLSDQSQWQVEVEWPGPRRGLITVGGEQGWLPFHATVVAGKGVSHLTPRTGADPLYKNLLLRVMPYLAGETDEPPLTMRQLIRPEMMALGALESRRSGGEYVPTHNLLPGAAGYDGAAFAAAYKAERGK